MHSRLNDYGAKVSADIQMLWLDLAEKIRNRSTKALLTSSRKVSGLRASGVGVSSAVKDLAGAM